MGCLITKLHTPPDKCKTAADVIEAARAVQLRRRTIFAPPTPAPLKQDERKFLTVVKAQVSQGIELKKLTKPQAFRKNPDMSTKDGCERVIALIAQRIGLTPAALLGHNRTPLLVAYRDAAIVLALRVTRSSNLKVGQMFGGRDQSTVRDSKRRLNWLMRAMDQKLPDRNASLEDRVTVVVELVDNWLTTKALKAKVAPKAEPVALLSKV